MSKPFKLNSAFKPSGDQPEAIRRLEEGLEDGLAHQTLLGVTAQGKPSPLPMSLLTFSAQPWYLRPTKRWRPSCMAK